MTLDVTSFISNMVCGTSFLELKCEPIFAVSKVSCLDSVKSYTDKSILDFGVLFVIMGLACCIVFMGFFMY